MDFDTFVKLYIYQAIADTTHPPEAGEVARGLGAPEEDVLASFERLHARRLLVPEPGDPRRIRMAPPFSGIETPFLVKVGEKAYSANCAWDALGVAAALHADAVVDTHDAFNGEPLDVVVRNGHPLPKECVAHFAVPAAQWWKDIVYT
jgi:hypothetical protein